MKRIGIVGTSFETTFGVPIAYAEYLAQFGNVQILGVNQFSEVDLLVLPGGNDVNPLRYGRSPGYSNTKVNPFFEHFDVEMLPKYIEVGTPIFGICRGLQTLNVHFGGGLIQDLPYHPYSNPREERVHGIFRLDNEGNPIVNKGKKEDSGVQQVNSLHHQCIDPKRIGEGLKPIYKSQSGIIEAIEHTSLPIKAVQWHPEEIRDEIANQMIRSLLN